MSATIRLAMCDTTGPPECEALEVHCTLDFDEAPSKPANPEIIDRAFDCAAAACHEALREGRLRRR